MPLLRAALRCTTQRLRRFDHHFELGASERAADRHEAAIGREQEMIRIDVLECASDSALHRIEAWRGRVARIDAAEHEEPVAAGPEDRGIVVAPGKLDGETADARLHQLLEQR